MRQKEAEVADYTQRYATHQGSFNSLVAGLEDAEKVGTNSRLDDKQGNHGNLGGACRTVFTVNVFVLTYSHCHKCCPVKKDI